MLSLEGATLDMKQSILLLMIYPSKFNLILNETDAARETRKMKMVAFSD